MPDILDLFHHKRRAKSLIVSSVSINHIKIYGKIMAISFSKLDKVTAQVSPLDQNGNPMPASALTGFAATISDTTIAKILSIDPVNLDVVIGGVADGATTIVYSGTNSAGTVISITDNITIADVPVLIATTLQVVYSAPIPQ